MSCSIVLMQPMGSAVQVTVLGLPSMPTFSSHPPSSRRWTSWTTSILPCLLASNWVQSMRRADARPEGWQRGQGVGLPPPLPGGLCQQPSYNHPPPSPVSAPSPCPSGLQVVGSCPWLLSLLVLHQLSYLISLVPT